MSYICINLGASKFQRHQVTGVEMAPSTDILALCFSSHPMWVSLPSGETQDRGMALTKKKKNSPAAVTVQGSLSFWHAEPLVRLGGKTNTDVQRQL